MISKEQVLKVLGSITIPGKGEPIVDNVVKNINIFGDEIVIDIDIDNPSLQAKKRLEVDILKAIHDNINPKIKIQVNIKVITPKKNEATPNIIRGKQIKGIHNIVAIASGKGGVGKSTVATNLAISLQQMGFKIGFLDADVYGPSAPVMLDAVDERPRSIKVDGVSKIKPIESRGIKILSMGFFTKPNQAVIWRGPMASKALNQMIFDAAWGELDFLIIDLPPGTGDIHLSIMQALPITGAVIVSTPQIVALTDARKGIAMFEQENIQIPVLGLVENMAYFTPDELPDKKYYIFGQNGAKLLADKLNIPFLGEIPINQSIREASDVGRPAVLQGENSSIGKCMKEITKNMVEQVVKRNKNLPPSKAIEITNMSGCKAI